jgi:RNA polymerase sigma factor (sigma-70 family)
VALRVATVMGAGAEAEDAVQEAFVKAYRSLHTFREGAPFRPWLLRILANEVANQRRAAGRRAARERSWWDGIEPLLMNPDDDPALVALSAQRRANLVRALARLPEAHRRVVTCRYLLDLDEAETAAALGLARGTVKSRLYRGLRQMARLLSDPAPSLPAQEVDRGV